MRIFQKQRWDGDGSHVRATHASPLRGIFLFLFIFLFSLSAHATTTQTLSTSLENTNFLINRSQHSINDEETLRAEYRFIYENEKNLKLHLAPRIQIDFLDFSRNRYVPNEFYALAYSNHWETSFGLEEKTWGASTFYKPTDVLNRSDFESNFYAPEKLGEVMWDGKYTTEKVAFLDDFSIEAILLPLFQKTPLPELNTRFEIRGRAGFVPYSLFDSQDTPTFTSSIGGALKIEGTWDKADLSFNFYRGPDHMPGYQLTIDSSGALRIQPFYYTVDMLGFNASIPTGNFVFHLEAAYKITAENDPRPHAVAFEENDALPKSYLQYVPGFDYTFHQFAGDGDCTFIIEYLGEPAPSRLLRNFRPFQNDVFFGFRYDFLNAHDSQISFGVAKDVTNREVAVTTEISTKIYKELKGSVGGIFVRRDGNINSPISYFDNNSQVFVRLSYARHLGSAR